MPRRKQAYKITYPNGKTYVGSHAYRLSDLGVVTWKALPTRTTPREPGL